MFVGQGWRKPPASDRSAYVQPSEAICRVADRIGRRWGYSVFTEPFLREPMTARAAYSHTVYIEFTSPGIRRPDSLRVSSRETPVDRQTPSADRSCGVSWTRPSQLTKSEQFGRASGCGSRIAVCATRVASSACKRARYSRASLNAKCCVRAVERSPVSTSDSFAAGGPLIPRVKRQLNRRRVIDAHSLRGVLFRLPLPLGLFAATNLPLRAATCPGW